MPFKRKKQCNLALCTEDPEPEDSNKVSYNVGDLFIKKRGGRYQPFFYLFLYKSYLKKSKI